jgi:hypothetical protein
MLIEGTVQRTVSTAPEMAPAQLRTAPEMAPAQLR